MNAIGFFQTGAQISSFWRRIALWGLGALIGGGWLAVAQPAEDCLLVVGVHWPGHNLAQTQIRVFRDPQQKELVAAVPAPDASGKIAVWLPAGTYYLTAIVDADNNSKLSAGDGLGFYGVQEPATQQPQPLELREPLKAVLVPIVLIMTPEGKLAPTGVRLPETAAQTETPPKPCLIAGMIKGSTGKLCVVYLVPPRGRFSYVALPDAEGHFSLSAPPGEYYLFAVEDANETEGIDEGDLWAIYGYQAEQGRLFPKTLVAHDLLELTLSLDWRMSETGLLKSLEEDTRVGPQIEAQTLPTVLICHLDKLPSSCQGYLHISLTADFSQIVGKTAAPNGDCVVALAAGIYYVSAWAFSAAQRAEPAPGDFVGFYGVSDIRKAHGPQPLALQPGEIRKISISLIARLDEQLRPQPIE